MIAVERKGQTFVVSSIAVSTDDAIAQCYGPFAMSNAQFFATAPEQIARLTAERDELRSALKRAASAIESVRSDYPEAEEQFKPDHKAALEALTRAEKGLK